MGNRTMPGEEPHVPDGLSDTLRRAAECGIIDTAHVASELEAMKTKEVLEAHKNRIWQGENGYWYTHLPDENRTLIKKKTKESLEAEIVRRVKEAEEAPTMWDIFKEWNDRRAANEYIKPSTHDVNEELFGRVLGDFGARQVRNTSCIWVVEFLEGLAANGQMTAKAFSNAKGLVKGTLKEAHRKGLVSYTADNVFQELDVPERAFRQNVKSDAEETFSPDEVKKIISYLVDDPTIRNLAVLLMFISGVRIGELVSLKWDDIEGSSFVVDKTETRKKNEDGKWEFYVRESAKTKAGERVAVIPEDYSWIWDAIRQAAFVPGEYLFVNEEGERLTANCIRSRLKKVCRRLRIPPRSPHKARKTYCSMLFESHRLDSVQITRLMGHTDISTSERFYHRDRTDIDQKINAVSQIPEFKI